MGKLINVLRGKDLGWWALTFTMLLALIGLAFYSLVTGKDMRVIDMIIAALLMRLGTLIDFKYGSSKGSREKTELLNQKNEKDGQ